MALSDKEIAEKYRSGLTVKEIALLAGMSNEWTRRRIKAIGCDMRRAGPSRSFNPSKEELNDLYQRMTLLEIAKRYGVGETAVWNRVKEHGIAVEGRKLGHRGLHVRTRRHKEAQSIARRGRWAGEKNPHWKGGVHQENLRARGSGAYKQWKLKALELHGNACQKCGVAKGSMCECCGYKINLHVHHVHPFASHPELRFDPNNSEVLCPKCHAISHGRIIG